MPIALIAAAVGAVGAIGGAVISSHAANNATNAAANAAAANNALSSQEFNTIKGDVQPYIDRGNTAADALQGFLGLGGDPAKTQAAFNNYLNSTGYQFDLNQGLQAAEQSKAAQGLYNSGATLKALNAFGTGEAQRYGDAYAGRLAGVSDQGQQAIRDLSGAGNANVTNQSNNNNSAATAAGNASLANASNINGLIGQAFNAYGTLRGASSYGSGGGGGNAFSGSWVGGV